MTARLYVQVVRKSEMLQMSAVHNQSVTLLMEILVTPEVQRQSLGTGIAALYSIEGTDVT